MYETELRQLRTDAVKAHNVAKEKGAVIAKGEATPEDREAFNKAKDDALRMMKEIESFEALAAGSAKLDSFNEPDPETERAVRRSAPANAPEKDHRERFNAAYAEAYTAYIRHGSAVAAAKLTPVVGETEAFNIVQGHMDLSESEKHALVGKDLELGGFLLREDERTELIKNLAGFAVIRGNATVKTTSGRAVTWPTVNVGTDPYSSNMDAGNTNVGASNNNWKGEATQTGGTAPSTQDKPTFGNIRIPTHLWEPNAVELGRDLLSDAAVNLEAELRNLFAEVKALDEDWAFIRGDGSGKPQGIVYNVDGTGGITSVVSGHATLLTYAGLLDLWAGLPAQYRQRAKFLMSSATYATILQLESTGGFPLFPPNSLPNQLLGKEILFSEFMPAIAGNAFPIVFGDFTYYYVVDQNEVRVQRLVERFAPNVGILVYARVGGQVARTQAFRAQKVST